MVSIGNALAAERPGKPFTIQRDAARTGLDTFVEAEHDVAACRSAGAALCGRAADKLWSLCVVCSCLVSKDDDVGQVETLGTAVVATVEEVTRLVFYPADVHHAVDGLGVQFIVHIDPLAAGVFRKGQRFESGEALSAAGSAQLQQLTFAHAVVVGGHKTVDIDLVVVFHAERGHEGARNLFVLAVVGVAACCPQLATAEGGLAAAPVGAGTVGSLIEQHDTGVVGGKGIVGLTVAARRILVVVEVPCHDERDDIERGSHLRIAIDGDHAAQCGTVVFPSQEVGHVVGNDGQRHLRTGIVLAVDGFRRHDHLAPLGTVASLVDCQRIGLDSGEDSCHGGIATDGCRIVLRLGQRIACTVLPLLNLVARQVLGRKLQLRTSDGRCAYGRHGHIACLGRCGSGRKGIDGITAKSLTRHLEAVQIHVASGSCVVAYQGAHLYTALAVDGQSGFRLVEVAPAAAGTVQRTGWQPCGTTVGGHQYIDGQCPAVVTRHAARELQVLVARGRQFHLCIIVVLGGIGGVCYHFRRCSIHAQGTVVIVGDVPFFVGVARPDGQRTVGQCPRCRIEEGLLGGETVLHVLLCVG